MQGQVETVDHYLLDCENYEEAREKLRSALYFITAKVTLELEVLLATTENENYKYHIEILVMILLRKKKVFIYGYSRHMQFILYSE